MLDHQHKVADAPGLGPPRNDEARGANAGQAGDHESNNEPHCAATARNRKAWGDVRSWLWLREYDLAEARGAHIAAGRHLRAALSSLFLAAVVILGRVTRTRP